MELIKIKAKGLKQQALACILCFGLLAFSFRPAQAQTFAEWFSQKKTQIKYLNDQITGLVQYGSAIRQGYLFASQGLGGISGWMKSEFDLHNSYYSSLRSVNPVIKNNAKADSIVRMAQGIPLQFDRLNELSMDAGYRTYVACVRAQVLGDCDAALAELQQVLGSGVAMSDDERIKRLNLIYRKVEDQLVFSRSFCGQVRVLMATHDLEWKDLQTQQGIYENN